MGNGLSSSHPTPETIYEFDIELTSVTHALLPGHSIRVTITSSHFPAYARSLNRFGSFSTLDRPRVAENTVYHGPGTLS